jgi:hypothetical protein
VLRYALREATYRANRYDHAMKRDMDLVRQILMVCETAPGGYAPDDLRVEGYTDEQIGYHVMLMVQAGLMEGGDRPGQNPTSPTWRANNLTWEGHEFLDSVRNDTTWNKAKSALGAVGGMTFGVLKAVLAGYLTSEATKHLNHK